MKGLKGIFLMVLPAFLAAVLCIGAQHILQPVYTEVAWAGKVTKYIKHKVLVDETVSKIAKAYGSDVEKLKEENSVEKNELKAGQHIVVPVESYEERTII